MIYKVAQITVSHRGKKVSSISLVLQCFASNKLEQGAYQCL